MGSKLHQSVLKAVADIGKNIEHEGGGGGDQAGAVQQLLEAMRSAKTNPNLAQMMPAAGGAPPPPMPPMPPMGA